MTCMSRSKGFRGVQTTRRNLQALSKQALSRLAQVLLISATAMLVACPYPSFEVQENQPLILDEELLVPALGLVPPLDCTGGNAGENVEFRLDGAVQDLDGDDLSTFWFINYDKSGFINPGLDTLTVNCLTGRIEPGLNLIEVIVTDRPPSPITAETAREAGPGGFHIRIYWVLEALF